MIPGHQLRGEANLTLSQIRALLKETLRGPAWTGAAVALRRGHDGDAGRPVGDHGEAMHDGLRRRECLRMTESACTGEAST